MTIDYGSLSFPNSTSTFILCFHFVTKVSVIDNHEDHAINSPKKFFINVWCLKCLKNLVGLQKLFLILSILCFVIHHNMLTYL